MRKTVWFVALLTCMCRDSSSQGLEGGPRGTIFASSSQTPSRDVADVTASVSAAYDREPPPELRGRLLQNSLSAGYSSMFTGAARYEHTGNSATLSSQALTALQYYPRLGRVVALTHGASAGISLRMSPQTSLEVSQSAGYSPSYLYRLFPAVAEPAVGDVPPSGAEYRIDETRSFSYDTRVAIRVGRPLSNQVSGTLERGVTDFSGGGIPRPDLDTTAGGVEFAHAVSRAGGLFVSYQYREGRFFGSERSNEQRVSIGVNVSKALSTTRRVQFRLGLTPSTIEVPASAATSVTGSLYRVEADGSMDYPMSLNWTIRGAYQRGMEYIAVLREPIFRDATRVEVSGRASERVDLNGSVGAVTGGSVFERGTGRLDTYTGTFRARYSLNRSLAFYAQYLYYYYNLHGQAALAPDLPSRFEQHSVRAGLMLWARPVGR